jgi:hypothetical protein
MTPVSWMSARKAADHLGFDTLAAFYKWLQRERADAERLRRPCRVKVHWLRGRMRFQRTQLDALIESEVLNRPSERSA